MIKFSEKLFLMIFEFLNSDAWYFIASTILAIIFFYLGIWYNKKLLNKSQISFVINEWLPIVTRAKDIQFLQLQNYVPPQDTNVYYLKAILANTGNEDIERGNIYKSLAISFPEGYKISKSTYFTRNDIDVSFIAQSNSVEISWNLFKPYESIHMELIIETVDTITQPELEKKIAIKHRILNVGNAKIFSFYPDSLKYYEQSIKMSNFFMVGIIAVTVYWEYLIFKNYRNFSSEIVYTLKFKNKWIVNNFHHVNDSILKFKIQNKEYLTKITDIPKVFHINTSSEAPAPHYWGPLILFVIMFAMMLFINLNSRKRKKQAILFKPSS